MNSISAENSIKKPRFNSIDIARGVAMLLVVHMHTTNFHHPLTDSWRLFIFYMIIGFFIKPTDIHSLLTKKMNALIIPLVVLSVPDLIISAVNAGIVDTIKLLFNPYRMIHSGNWFIFSVLWIYLFHHFVSKISRKMLRYGVVVAIVGAFSTLSNMYVFDHRIVLPLWLSSAMCMYAFIAIGEIIRPKLFALTSSHNMILGVLCIILWLLEVYFNGGMRTFDTSWAQFNQPFVILLLRSTLAIIGILCICRPLPKLPIISTLGEHSLIVLLTHSYFIRLLELFTDNVWVIFISSIILCIAFIHVSLRYFPRLVGAKVRK